MNKTFLLFFSFFIFLCEAKLPEISPQDVTVKVKEIMKAHASQKVLTMKMAEKVLTNYLDHLDSNRTYFIESDINEWLTPSEALLQKIVSDFDKSQFDIFEKIHNAFIEAIQRKRLIESSLDYSNLPQNVSIEEFKNPTWAKTKEELGERLRRIRSLRLESSSKLSEELKEKSMQRIAKRQSKYEDDMMTSDGMLHERLVLSQVLKAFASSLDSHTVYFTPDEAKQFMIDVQQCLFGIGAQLRDDLNGFTVVKIVEGGPAALGKQLKAKDRIIAINGEPVVGMDIISAVELIRGEAQTPVILTIIRDVKKEDGTREEEKLDITVLRGEVVLKEARFKSEYEPFGDGIIGYIKLNSFYQDRDHSSASDLEKEIENLKQRNMKGLILDLRYNSGGLLTQAVEVTGLFITKGIVVSIKDENGKIKHLRDLDGMMAWDGPLVVLVNRMSASASEIVAQTLQDYGRALVVGDDHTFGKGSYQTFTLATTEPDELNPQGEYKVTRGRYYTVSGKTPQLTGVISDIAVPGILSESEIGERFAKFPLENDSIKPNFNDDLADISIFQRDRIRHMYGFGLQEKQVIYPPFLEKLKANSQFRLANNFNYQNMLIEIKKKDDRDLKQAEIYGLNDLQLEETYSIMKDLLFLMDLNEKNPEKLAILN